MIKDLSKSSVVSKGFMQGTNVALRGRALLVVQYVGGKVADWDLWEILRKTQAHTQYSGKLMLPLSSQCAGAAGQTVAWTVERDFNQPDKAQAFNRIPVKYQSLSSLTSSTAQLNLNSKRLYEKLAKKEGGIMGSSDRGLRHDQLIKVSTYIGCLQLMPIFRSRKFCSYVF